jgi:probable HAF family extracellular repeat protein
MSRSRFLVLGVLGVIFAIISMLAAGAARGDVLDQANDEAVTDVISFSEINIPYDFAQTFTVGLSGQLSRIELDVWRKSVTTQNLRVDIRRTVAGTPVASDSQALGVVTLPPSAVPIEPIHSFPYVPQFTSIDFSSFNIQVHSGDVLAIALHCDATDYYHGYLWHTSNQGVDNYPRGTEFGRYNGGAWYAPQYDCAFHTFVTVPEPSMIVLLLAGALASIAVAWRKMKRGVVTLTVAVLLSIVAATACRAAQYAITDLGVLPGYTSSYARGMNDRGEVVGYSYSNSGMPHAFLYSHGTIADLGTLGGTISDAYGINAGGQVAGWSTDSHGAFSGFVYSNGTMTKLGSLGGAVSSNAYGINNNGQVVGDAYPGNYEHAALFSNGTISDLGTLPGGTYSMAMAINAGGQIVGDSTNGSYWHAFLYSGGKMTDLGTFPGGVYSHGYGINDAGQVVGQSRLEDTGDWHAFLYSGGVMTDLNQLTAGSGWDLQSAMAMNNVGQIAGSGLNPAGQPHAFLLTPVPEPSSIVLLCVAAVGLFALAWQRTHRAAVSTVLA